MSVPMFVKAPIIALTLVFTGTVLAPQTAQAHHNAVHSTEQAVTKTVSDTAATVKVAVKPASDAAPADTSKILPLTTGAAVLLSIAGLGLYSRKQQSV